MICKEFDEMSIKGRTDFIGKLVHAVQSDSRAYWLGDALILGAERRGVFTNVIINPSSDNQ